MMNAGSTESAIVLAKQRWQQHFAFDLDADTWSRLFVDFDGRDVLQAITVTKRFTHSAKPATVYSRFEQVLKGLVEKRYPMWPPSDVNQN
jgi:hypothetical protein